MTFRLSIVYNDCSKKFSISVSTLPDITQNYQLITLGEVGGFEGLDPGKSALTSGL